MEKEIDWHEGQIEIQDEYGNFRNVIVINDGTVQYWAVLDRPVNEAIEDFCKYYHYSEEHDGEDLEIGVSVIGEINGGLLSYRLGTEKYPHLKE